MTRGWNICKLKLLINSLKLAEINNIMTSVIMVNVQNMFSPVSADKMARKSRSTDYG
jgi:hypothetical protein